MTHEKTIRDFYAGWEKKDWDAIANTLARGFTFTSPQDQALSQIDYKDKCWPTAPSIGTYEFLTLMEKGDEAFARWKCLIGGESVTNTEYFLFEGEKIKKVEVYFGQPSNI
jgi:hypothetical protein